MKFLYFCAVLAMLAMSVQARDILVIDAWNAATEYSISIQIPSPNTTLPISSTRVTTGTGILGGERDSVLTVSNGPPFRVVSSSVSENQWTVAYQTATTGSASITWDGVDNNANALNVNGLNTDLTQGGAVGFHIRARTDQPTSFILYVVPRGGPATNNASYVLNLTPSADIQDYHILFTSFTNYNLAKFTSMGALQVFCTAGFDVDALIDVFATFAPSVAGHVYRDCDLSCTQNSEANFVGANVVLRVKATQSVVSSGVTDANGNFLLTAAPQPGLEVCVSASGAEGTCPSNSCQDVSPDLTNTSDFTFSNPFGLNLPTTVIAPQDVTVACTANTASSATGTATATGCANPVITQSDTRDDTVCAEVILRTWTATGPDRVSTAVQRITLTDTVAPTFATFPANVTRTCGSDTTSASTGSPTGTDNCHTFTITQGDSSSVSTCPRIITRTWTITDACGNLRTQNQAITVTDTVAPTFVGFPTNRTQECGTATTTDITGAPTATDACNSATNPAFTDVVTGTSCSRLTTRTWTTSDTCNNRATQVQTISVTDTTAPTFTFVPATTQISCGASTAPANTGGSATATDAFSCSTVTISSSDANTGTGCSAAITRTWTATDACSNRATAIQTINIIDTVAPTFTGTFPVDRVNLACGTDISPASMGTPTATDCSGSPTVTSTDAVSGTGCSQTTLRTWRATDLCGNNVERVQTLIRIDSVAPTYSTFPSNVTVQCGTDLSDTGNTGGNPTATDACNGVASITFTDTTTGPVCGQSITRRWVAVDGCGNQNVRNQLITTTDSTRPTFTFVPAAFPQECGLDTSNATTGLPTATDNCQNPVLLSSSDTITGTSCNRVITRIFTARDACGNSATASQTITVTDNTPPTFVTFPSDTTIACGTSNSSSITGTPTTSDCNTVSLTQSDVLSGSGCNSAIQRTWTATDACGRATSSVQNIFLTDNIAPVFSNIFVANRTLECNVESTDPSNTGTPTATDSCSVVQSVTSSDGSVTGNSCSSSFLRTWTATDGCTNSVSRNQLLTVVDTRAPTFVNFPANALNLDCNANIDAGQFTTATATDLCSTVNPITFVDSTSGTTCRRTTTRTFTATDACTRSTSQAQTIVRVDSTAPVLSIPASDTYECGTDISVASLGSATATDDCSTFTIGNVDTVTGTACNRVTSRVWTATDTCTNSVSQTQIITVLDRTNPTISTRPQDWNLECGATTTVAARGTITGTDSCTSTSVTIAPDVVVGNSCLTTITRVFTLNDACSNTASHTQTITLTDSQAPTFTSFPNDLTAECGANPGTLGTPVTADSCSNVVSPLTLTVSDNGNSCNLITTRTWTASDVCGHSVSRDQTVTIRDTTAPTFDFFPANIAISCDVAPTTGNTNGVATATDGCGNGATVTFQDSQSGTGCNLVITRVFTAVDDCDNARTQAQTITVRDSTPPSFDFFPNDVSLACTADHTPSGAAGTPQISDNCDGEPSLSFSDDIEQPLCPGDLVIRRTWEAIDGCGNRVTRDQILTITLDQDPVLVVPEATTVECSTILNPSRTGQATATSPCGLIPTVTYADVLSSETCPTTVTRTWTASDACGNAVTGQQIITLVDTTPPIFIEFPADAEIYCATECTDPSCLGRPVAADNCDPDICAFTFFDTTLDQTRPNALACQDDLIIIRTWSASDNCGNSFSRNQTIYIEYLEDVGVCPQGDCPRLPCTPDQCPSSCNCGNQRPCNPVPCTPVACRPVECTDTDDCDCSLVARNLDGSMEKRVPGPHLIVRADETLPFCDETLDVPCVPTYVFVHDDDDDGGKQQQSGSSSDASSLRSGSLFAVLMMVLIAIFL